jgi:hypothetical protein
MSNPKINLHKLQQKSYYATLRDGITELFAGFMLIVMAGIVQKPFLTAFIGIVIIFLPKLLTRIKEHHIYPRIGIVEVEPKEDPNGARTGILFIVFSIMGYVGLVLLLEEDYANSITWINWLPILMSMLFLPPSHFLASNSGKKAYYLFFISSLALAIGLIFVNTLQGFDKLSIFMLIIGFLAIIVGILKLWIFIQGNPIVNENEISEIKSSPGDNNASKES